MTRYGTYGAHHGAGASPGIVPTWLDADDIGSAIARPEARAGGVLWSPGGDYSASNAIGQDEYGLIGWTGSASLLGARADNINLSRAIGEGKGVWMATADASPVLYYSPDGETDFTVQTANDGATPFVTRDTFLRRGALYWGEVAFSAVTPTWDDTKADLVLDGTYEVHFVVEYRSDEHAYTDTKQCRILVGFKGAQAETDGIENNLYVLMTPTAGGTAALSSVRHFHGVFKGGGALWVATGDSTAGDAWNSTLLYCDDVADLVENADEWKTKWGLDKVGTTRRAWFDTGGTGVDYCADLLTNEADFKAVWSDAWTEYPNTSQLARTVELVVDQWDEYGYFIPDMTASAGNAVLRVNLSTREVELIGSGVMGTGWFGTRVDNGGTSIVCLSSQSAHEGAYVGNDEFVRMYAVTPKGDGWVLLKRWYRGIDTTTGTTVDFDTVESLGGVIYAAPRRNGGQYGQPFFGQTTVAGIVRLDPDAPYARRNLIGVDIEGLADAYDIDAAGSPWYDSHQTDVVTASAAIVPDGYTRAIVHTVETGETTCQLVLRHNSAAQKALLDGYWLTATVYAMLPATAHANQAPKLQLALQTDENADGSGDTSLYQTVAWPTNWRDGLWHDWSVHLYVPADHASGTLRVSRVDVIVQSHVGGAAGEGWVLYTAGWRLARGVRPVKAHLQSDGSFA